MHTTKNLNSTTHTHSINTRPLPSKCTITSLSQTKPHKNIPHSIPRHNDDNTTTTTSTSEFRKNPTLYSTTPSSQHHHRLSKKKPEVLAPAGGWPQLYAAVENGADAVYFGCTSLNARARASNFTPEELPTVMSYLHERGVKGYLVINVLCFDNELTEVAHLAQQAYTATVDAVIVQDIGAVEVIRKAAPNLPIHASTQMTITSAEGASFAASIGIERVVVGRELSIKDIASVSSGSRTAEVEAFVHGALCVSYSGQCFSSEAWGGRSANRGQCAQACRKEYGLLVDGQLQYLGDVQYLLSPQDLAAVELVPQLIDAGVVSFKIEGRLKGPEYVAITTKTYRQAVDKAWNKYLNNQPPQKQPLDPDTWNTLHQVFARGQDGAHKGLTTGFLEGPRHQQLVRGRAPRHRGIFLGEIIEITDRGSIIVSQLSAGLKKGDGVVVDAGDAGDEEIGGVVADIITIPLRKYNTSGGYNSNNGNRRSNNSMKQQRGGGSNSNSSRMNGNDSDNSSTTATEIVLFNGNGAATRTAQFNRQRRHHSYNNNNSNTTTTISSTAMYLWKNKDVSLESSIRSTYENLSSSQRRRRPVSVTAYLNTGHPLRIEISDDESGYSGVGVSNSCVEQAATRPLMKKDIEKAIGKNVGDEGSLVMTSLRIIVNNTEEYNSNSSNSITDNNTNDQQQQQQWNVFISASEIKEARRHAVTQLLEQHTALPSDIKTLPSPDDIVEEMLHSIITTTTSNTTNTNTTTVRVLCRTKEQVDAVIAIPDNNIEIILDFLEVHGLKEACHDVKQAKKRVIVAMPRIIKPDEQRLWVFYLKLGADALLVRGTGVLHQFMELGGPGAIVPGADNRPIPRLEGDFSLNASNVISTHALLSAGLDRIAPTHDCNAAQLADIARNLGYHAASTQLEGIIHTNLPVFHTEACLFARFLSNGESFLDCGHPCEHHTVHLRENLYYSGTIDTNNTLSFDKNNNNNNNNSNKSNKSNINSLSPSQDHLVLADMGCRNTVFTASAQSALPFIDELVRSGYRTFRIELVDQPASVVPMLVEGYRRAIEDSVSLTMSSMNNNSINNSNNSGSNSSNHSSGNDTSTTHDKKHQNNTTISTTNTNSTINKKKDDIRLQRKDFWNWMQYELRDANGRSHGVGIGSLEVRQERSKESMKPTAASLKYGREQKMNDGSMRKRK